MTYLELTLCFKTLGDETRARIVDMLKTEPLCACKILEEFNISQPTLSYHMKMLVDSRLVFCEKKGIWNHYSLNLVTLGEIAHFLSKDVSDLKGSSKCDCKTGT